MTSVLIRRGRYGHWHRQRDGHVKTQGEDGHLQVKERGLKQILPSQLSVGINPADTLISDS